MCVLGAGRGPLIQCCIKASKNTGIPIQLSAIEKNPFAYCSLLQRVNFAGGCGNGSCLGSCTDDGDGGEGECNQADDSNNSNTSPDSDSSFPFGKCACLQKKQTGHISTSFIVICVILLPETRQSLRTTAPIPTTFRHHDCSTTLLSVSFWGHLGTMSSLSPECLCEVEWLLTSPHRHYLDQSNNSNMCKDETTTLTDDNIPVLNQNGEPTDCNHKNNNVDPLLVSLQGYSIPNQSRSFLVPVSTSDIYNGIIAHNIAAASIYSKLRKGK